jgi:hypothetical protein
MRTKVTLVLLFLNVALFFFIFRFERRWRTEDSWKEARRRVLGAEAADIRTLEIAGPGRTTIALSKRGETWFITRPLEWPANPNAVSRIVNELQFLEHATSFHVRDLAKNGQSLSDYGLDQPKLTVTFSSGLNGTDTPGPVTLLRIGATTPDGARLYVLSPDGERVHVVNQSLARSLALTFDELHADTVFTIPVFEARSLNLQTAAPASLRIRLRRDGNQWTFETPSSARASKNATELAINALNALRVKTFLTTTPPPALPAEKPLRISLEGNNRRETLILGDEVNRSATPAPNTDREFYAQLDGRAALFTVTLPASLIDTLERAQETLRETRLLDFAPRAITSITLTAPNQPPLTLQRLETGEQTGDAAWQIVLRGDGGQAPQTLPADRAAVGRLLEQLGALSARRFQSDAPRDADLESWGFNRPEREITLGIAGTAPVALQIGLATQRDGLAYARIMSTPGSIYAIDPEILRETPVQPRAWRERLLRELPAGARITALKLTDIARNQTLLETSIDGAGRPAGAGRAAAAVQTILEQLRTLRAKEFVLDQFVDQVNVAGEERPWRYRLEATVTLNGGAGEQTSTTTLFVAVRTGGDQQLAGSPEYNAVFALEQPLVDALWAVTEGPRDPGPPPVMPASSSAPTPATPPPAPTK